MSIQVTRRDVLIGSVASAGLLALGSMPPAQGAEPLAVPNEKPDRSAQAPTSPVAVQRCESYDPPLVRARVDAALKDLGGIKDLVSGKTVTIKLNITGSSVPMGDRPAFRTYQTHPNVVAALCAALVASGAKQIVLVEGFYFREAPQEALKKLGWDIAAIEAAGEHRVTFENTRNRGNWGSYSRLKVSWGGFLFPSFDVNARYEKTDVFMSLAKLKDHYCAGITGAVKNLFGMTPMSLYGDGAPNEDSLESRGFICHAGTAPTSAGVPREHPHKMPEGEDVSFRRIPRIVADCLGARPVDLAIIDAVETVVGGEGPWIRDVSPTTPRLLVAGRNAVCTDSVCAGIMGYDPNVDHFQFPFPGENHLRWLAVAGVGTNDLKRIEVRGLPIAEAKHRFRQPNAPAPVGLGTYRVPMV